MEVPFENCLVVDFEASGIHQESWPTELAWANPHPDPTSTVIKDRLIRPVSDWTHWDPKAEEITGITRHHLELHGTSPAEVLEEFMKCAEGKVLVSDAPQFDAFWLRRLIDAAEAERGAPMNAHFRFADLDLVFLDLAERRHPATSPQDALIAGERAQKLVEESVETAKLICPPTHRAGDDVRHHLEVIRILLAD